MASRLQAPSGDAEICRGSTRVPHRHVFLSVFYFIVFIACKACPHSYFVLCFPPSSTTTCCLRYRHTHISCIYYYFVVVFLSSSVLVSCPVSLFSYTCACPTSRVHREPVLTRIIVSPTWRRGSRLQAFRRGDAPSGARPGGPNTSSHMACIHILYCYNLNVSSSFMLARPPLCSPFFFRMLLVLLHCFHVTGT